MNEALGRVRDGIHIFPVRVYYEDTDAGGVVYYANYLKFAERARTDLLRIMGIEQSRLAGDEGVVFVVRRCAADFLRPARLDDGLEIHTGVTDVRGASVDMSQSVCRGGDELVRMDVRIACMKHADPGHPARIPKGIRTAFEAWRGVS
jgi:acyl-CoA thioester hydrolase